MSVAREGGADVLVAAPPSSVWRVVADVTRTGEWSGECRAVEWLHATTNPAPGARFRGHNRNGPRRWNRTCELTELEPPRVIAWRTLPSALFPDSCDWRIELTPSGSGTRITLTYQVRVLPRWYGWVVGVINPSHADRSAALTGDLERLGNIAGAETDHAPVEG